LGRRAAAVVCLFTLAGAAAQAQSVCDTHHLGYTEAECQKCVNMEWSVSRVFPRGVCVTKPGSPTTTSGGTSATTGWGSPPAPSCTPTHWGGATLSLRSGNFSGTGAPVAVCKNGYDLAKSQFKCSTGNPVQAFNYPKTNVSCNDTVAIGGNPQVTINGTPCCL
jgi:hypothetical protein